MPHARKFLRSADVWICAGAMSACGVDRLAGGASGASLRPGGDAAVQPRVPDGSFTAMGHAHAAMQMRVPYRSGATVLGDQRQFGPRKLRVVRRERHGLGAERQHRCRQGSIGKTTRSKHLRFPPRRAHPGNRKREPVYRRARYVSKWRKPANEVAEKPCSLRCEAPGARF